MPEDFRFRIAARWLGVPYTAVDDIPIPTLETAFQDWYALREADFRLNAKLRGGF